MGMIPPETIEQIAAANDIVEVIGSYFPVKRAGAVWKALCPFHNEKTPSFHINPARQSYHCFGCGAGGSVFRFVMAYESLDFVSAVKRLADRAGIAIVEQQMSAEDEGRLRLRKRLLELHKEAAEWFHKNLMRTPAAGKARDYLKGRGLTQEVAVNWTLGYAPDAWDAFGHWAESRGFTRMEIARSGLVSMKEGREEEGTDYYDRFRHRLMFPIRNDFGEVIAFSGRVLEAEQGENPGAKYVNSPETMLFTKGNVLFGLHASKRDLINAKTAIVCEGQIDLISAFEAGVRNVVAPQGTAFTERQAAMLKRFVEGVVLCFDADAAGEKAAERSLAALLDQGLLVRVATMPPGEDPDSLIRKRGAEAFREIVDRAPGFFDFQIARLPGNADVRVRQQFARKMGEFIALAKDPVVREDAIAKTVSRIGLLREDFEKLIPKVRAVSGATSELAGESSGLEFEPPSHAMHMLCLFALRDTNLRATIQTQPWPKLIDGEPGAEIFGRIVTSAVDAEKSSSLTGFLASLDPAEEQFVVGLLNERFTDDMRLSAGKVWGDFCRVRINRQLKRIQQAMLANVASGGDISDWKQQQNEILTLREQFGAEFMEQPVQAVKNGLKEVLDRGNVLTDVSRPSEPSEDPF